MRPWLLHALLPAVLPLLALLGLVQAGSFTHDSLSTGRSPSFDFADIEVSPPPGMTRSEFLTEVQYISDLHDTFTLQSDDALPRLEAAFAKHAWVEKVERITVRHQRAPLVQLRYRRAVLAVNHHGQVLPVDRRGMLLPRTALTSDLPVYRGKVTAIPATGNQWQDQRVLACAVVVGYLSTGQRAVKSATVDHRGVVLETSSGRVLWGSPPGTEAPGEADASTKRQRWLEASTQATLDLRTRP